MAYGAPPQPPPYPPAPYPPPPYTYGWAAAAAGPGPGLRYAGFWIRVLAYVIDWFVVGIPVGVVFAIALAPTLSGIHCTVVNNTSGGFQSANCTGLGPLFPGIGLWWLVTVLAPAVYSVLLWSLQGRTLGQRVLGLHVVDARTGARITIGRAVGRYLGLLISTWVLCIGLIWAAFDAQKQGWHDKMASTFVVRAA